MNPPFYTIRYDLRPGDIGYVVYLHGILYAQEYGLNYMLEGYVAGGLAEFVQTYDTGRNRLWVAEENDRIAGSIGIVGKSDSEAQLRWYIVLPSCRGRGLGRKLIESAIEFCRAVNYKSIFLWTFSDLKPAIHLYESTGFKITEEKIHLVWGQMLTEQRYDLEL